MYGKYDNIHCFRSETEKLCDDKEESEKTCDKICGTIIEETMVNTLHIVKKKGTNRQVAQHFSKKTLTMKFVTTTLYRQNLENF